jgi:diacylglycerol kinase family enzyme
LIYLKEYLEAIESEEKREPAATAIINPASTRYKQALKKLDRLEKAARFSIIRSTTTAYPHHTKAIIQEAFFGSDLVIVLGGDGAFHSVVRARMEMYDRMSDHEKRIPILSIGGGNAEDGLRANHTDFHRRHPEQLLNDGLIAETHPIRFDIHMPGHEENYKEHYWAAFYASLGATALATEALNSPKHRHSFFGKRKFGRLVSELPIAARSMVKSETNRVRELDGSERELYTELFINSGIMAKYLRFPVKLTEDRIFHLAMEQKRYSNTISAALAARRGKLEGDYLEPEDSVSFITTHDLKAQLDGEDKLGDYSLIPSQSQVRIGLDERSLRVVVTNPEL